MFNDCYPLKEEGIILAFKVFHYNIDDFNIANKFVSTQVRKLSLGQLS